MVRCVGAIHNIVGAAAARIQVGNQSKSRLELSAYKTANGCLFESIEIECAAAGAGSPISISIASRGTYTL